VSRTEPVFHQPLVADRSHIRSVTATAPRGDERDNGSGTTKRDHNPNGIHERSSFYANL
jgi:hypothetical protein